MRNDLKEHFHPMFLEVGKHYILVIRKKIIIAKFIKTTKKGFNFLNLNTNECIMKRHIYRFKNKYEDEYVENLYWVSKYITVSKT
jgi:hypothetical protein